MINQSNTKARNDYKYSNS